LPTALKTEAGPLYGIVWPSRISPLSASALDAPNENVAAVRAQASNPCGNRSFRNIITPGAIFELLPKIFQGREFVKPHLF
jgi:hypothetical protein